MTMRAWHRIKSRLRGIPLTPAADAPESDTCPTGSGAPFDLWTNALLWDKVMLVITEEGVFERASTGRWLLHRVHGPCISFGRELSDLTLFLEQETFHTYKQRIQEIHQ